MDSEPECLALECRCLWRPAGGARSTDPKVAGSYGTQTQGLA